MGFALLGEEQRAGGGAKDANVTIVGEDAGASGVAAVEEEEEKIHGVTDADCGGANDDDDDDDVKCGNVDVATGETAVVVDNRLSTRAVDNKRAESEEEEEEDKSAAVTKEIGAEDTVSDARSVDVRVDVIVDRDVTL